ncbi:MAG: TonB-dependent receptor [Myxococcota bacterium]
MRRAAALLLLGSPLLAGAAASQTQQADDPFAGVEVMEVVGSGTAALLESSNPSSMISFDTSDLEAIGATDVADVAAYTPNLEVKTAASTTAIFFIRGVGLADFSANATGSVSVSYDGVPMNSSALQLGQLFDTAAFNVLKGPQSGSSVRNASAGAIQVSSRLPEFDHAANLRFSYGRFLTRDAIDAPQFNVEGGLDTPIIPDILTSRISFTLKGQDPYIVNRCGGLPPIAERPRIRGKGLCGETLGQDPPGPTPPRPPFGVPAFMPTEVGQSFDMAGKAILKLLPPDTETSIVFNLHGRSLRQDSTVGEALGTGPSGLQLGGGTSTGYVAPEVTAERNKIRARRPQPTNINAVLAKNLAKDRPLDKEPFSGDYSRIGQTRMDSYGALLRAEGTFADVSLRSITAIDNYNRWRNADTDFTPDVLFESMTRDKAWQAFQDLNAQYTLADFPVELEGGFMYLYEDLYSKVDQSIEWPVIGGFTRTYTQVSNGIAGYARISVDFLEAFRLDMTGRYNWERKSFDIRQYGDAPTANVRGRTKTWQSPTGAISLTYSMTEDLDVYWKYSHGWKPGHFNSNTVRGQHATPEQIDAFEAGFNGAFWDSRVRMGAALFNYLYEDYQVFVFQSEFAQPPSLVVRNADAARVFGADADVTVEPLTGFVPEAIENLSLTLRFGWLETRFLRFVQLQPRIVSNRPVAIPEDNSGNPLINSPRFKVSGTIDWKLQMSERLGSLTPRYDFTWSDDIVFDPAGGRGALNGNGVRGNPKYRTGQPRYVIHNIRVTYKTTDERFAVAAWCRNLTDTRYKTAAFDVSAFSSLVLNFVGDPRSCGGEISLTW